MDYTDYCQQIAVIGSYVSTADAQLNTILPLTIAYAENRINADLDPISTITTENALTQPNNRNLTIPDCIYVVQDLNIITPSATNPDFGTRNPVERISVSMMNYIWPTASTTFATSPVVPDYYSVLNSSNIMLAPTPDGAYKAEIVGIFRPTPLSATNTETFISDQLPELMIAASMIYISGVQRDFGATSDDPARAQSWENQYKMLLESDKVVELRKKSQSSQWSPYSPSQLAPRT